jgi:hypothetical protein
MALCREQRLGRGQAAGGAISATKHPVRPILRAPSSQVAINDNIFRSAHVSGVLAVEKSQDARA